MDSYDNDTLLLLLDDDLFVKEEYINQLYEMMDNAPDEQSRKNIQKMIREMEQA